MTKVLQPAEIFNLEERITEVDSKYCQKSFYYEDTPEEEARVKFTVTKSNRRIYTLYSKSPYGTYNGIPHKFVTLVMDFTNNKYVIS